MSDGPAATLYPRDLSADRKELEDDQAKGDTAGLNFGDCFSYALATTRAEPLLFKGDDFMHTDVAAVLTR